ncbi:MAG: M23 family metallopeptidase [Opitutaceae bacterium]|nr:M23 family metallopeptidase [Opitutaceae bacterium]
MRLLLPVLLGLLLSANALPAERFEFVWPVPNQAPAQGKQIQNFVQSTASGETESGLFGCVRSGGIQFHEGIDLKPLQRDVRGEPLDRVSAAMAGIVRHVNNRAGKSSYGRYLVIEHTEVTPAVYTLYAHLRSVEIGIRPGVRVSAGQVIGVMGHTAGGYSIPRARAHLHFEIGLMVTRDFQGWYNWKKFGSPNEHGPWNGMNLMGFDGLDWFRQFRSGRGTDFQQYLDNMKPAVRVRISTIRVPDFIRRYPTLLRKPMPTGLVAGWEIECNWTGIPFAWTPLSAPDVAGLKSGSPQVVEVDSALLRAYRCKSLVRQRRGQNVPGSDLEVVLQQLFGWR